ncbi:hypothetical protein ACQY74_000484 (plasmid) [Rhizobium leguminosarum bv. trifolii]
MPQLIQVVIGWIVITRRSTPLPIRVFARRRSGVETWHGSEAAVRRRAEPSYGRLARAAHTKACLAQVGRVRLEANVDTRQARATISDHVAALVISPTSRRPSGPISWMPLRTAPDPAKTRQFKDRYPAQVVHGVTGPCSTQLPSSTPPAGIRQRLILNVSQAFRARRGTYAPPDRCSAQFERLSEMPNQRANDDELRDIIDQKLTALIQEMEDADWSAKDVAFAINDVLKSKWLDRMMALQDARDAVPKGFLSDGNEG